MKSKRLLSWVLVIAMVTSMLGGNAAFAEDSTTTINKDNSSGSLTITLKIKTGITPSVSITGWTQGAYDETVNSPTVTGNTGEGTVTYTYKVKGAEDGTYQTATPTDAGDYTVKAEIAETDDYKAGSATADFTIAAHSHVFNDTSYTAEGATITATCSGAGTCGLTGNKATLTLNAPAKTKDADSNSEKATLDGLEEFSEATGLSISTDSIEYYSGETKLNNAPTAAGSYTAKLTVKEQTAEVDYSIGTTTQSSRMTITLVIKEKATATAPTANTLTYTGSNQTLVSGGSATGGALQYAIGENSTTAPENGWSTNAPAGKDAKTYYVWYKAKGDNDHRDSDAACVPAEIKKANITPSVSISDWVYGATASTPSVEGNSGNGTVTYTYKAKGAADTAYSGTVPTAVGEYTVKAAVPETANYNSGSATKDFKITKADPSVTAPTAKNLTYNGNDQALVNAGRSTDGQVQYSLSENGTYGTAIPSKKDAGAYTVWYKVVGDSNHSDSTPASVDVNIAQKEVGLNWGESTFTYNGQAQAPTASATGVVNGDTCTVTVEGEQTAAGNYTATASDLSNSNYKLPSEVTKDYTINKAEITVSADNKSSQYQKDIQELTYQVTGAYVEDDDLGVSVSTTATKTSPVNTYPITVSWNNNPNYEATLNNGTYTITTVDAHITASAYNGTYDGKEHSITVSVTDDREGGLGALLDKVFGEPEKKEATVYYSTVSVEDALNQKNTTAPTRKDVGETTVYYAVEFGGNYKAEPPVTGFQKVTITAKEVGLSWSNTSFTYDSKSHIPSATATELVGNDACTVTVKGAQTNAGTYTATATNLSNSNYKLPSNAQQSFTIAPKEVELSWSNTSFTYDGKAHVPTVTAGDLVDGDTCTVTVEGAQTNAGTYAAKAAKLDNTNYKLSGKAEQSFTINKAEQSAPAAPKVSKTTTNAIVVKTNSGEEYSLDGKTWQKSGTFKGLQAGKSYKVYARKAESTNYKVSPASKATQVQTKNNYQRQINTGLKLTQTKNQLNVKWGKVDDANRYEVYATYCGKALSKKPTLVLKSNKVNTATITKLNGKKLIPTKQMRVVVVAKKGSKVLAKSMGTHVVGRKNKKLTNVKSVKLNKNSFTIKKGKTAQIKGTVTLANKKHSRMPDKHVAKFRFLSYDKSVATVDKNGKITAKGTGKCVIHVFAHNGLTQKVTVTVR